MQIKINNSVEINSVMTNLVMINLGNDNFAFHPIASDNRYSPTKQNSVQDQLIYICESAEIELLIPVHYSN